MYNTITERTVEEAIGRGQTLTVCVLSSNGYTMVPVAVIDEGTVANGGISVIRIKDNHRLYEQAFKEIDGTACFHCGNLSNDCCDDHCYGDFDPTGVEYQQRVLFGESPDSLDYPDEYLDDYGIAYIRPNH